MIKQVVSQSNKRGFVFIVGCPRSGTFLLTTMLNASISVAIPVETHFVPLFKRYLFLFGDLSKHSRRKRLLECIFDFLEIWTPRGSPERNLDAQRKFTLLVVRDRAQKILDESRSYTDIVNNLFREYATIHHAQICGDKSALYYPVSPSVLKQIIPDAYIIHLVRDGRDVCLSWMKGGWFGPKAVAEAARLWRDHVRSNREWVQKNRERSTIEVSYEDMLLNPDDVVDKVCVIMNTQSNGLSNWNKTEYAEVLSSQNTHEMLAQDINPANMMKWKTQMPATDCFLFEYIAGAELRRYGYELISSVPSFWRRVYYCIIIFASRLRAIFSTVYIRLCVKDFLPVIALFCYGLGIPLVKIVNGRRSRGTEGV